MTCEEAANLISARIDGELAADDGAALDAHLAECAACRSAEEAAAVQDAALLRAFAPRRAAAADLAERVVAEVAGGRPRVRPARADRFRSRLAPWAGWAAAAAAGVVIAVMVSGPRGRTPIVGPPAAVQPVAHLTLATGKVFTCPSDSQAWRPITPGDGVTPGGRVRTDGAKCELQLAGGGRVRLNAGTDACFAVGRDVRLGSGQMWSALPGGAAPVRVAAGPARVTTAGGAGGPGAQFDVACTSDVATVTVLAGTAEVAGDGPPATVGSGQAVRLPRGLAAYACAPVADPVAATRWQDELLVLKPADDPEVAARVGQLLARIATDQAACATPGRTTTAPAAGPGAAEADVRARGDAWSAPLACYVRPGPAPAPAAERRAAARLLADLAPPWSIPDLIDLLGDADGDVRAAAAAGLRRLTGQDLGPTPERCAAGRDPAAEAEWRAWWQANEGRYPPRPR